MANNQIALLANLPQFDGPLETQTKRAQLAALARAAETEQYEQQQRAMLAQDDASARAALRADPTGGQSYLASLASAGNVKGYYGALKANQERDKAAADVSETKAKAGKLGVEALNLRTERYKAALNNVNDAQGAAAWVQAMYADPDVGPHIQQELGPIESTISRIPDPVAKPAEFAAWKRGSQLGAEKLAEISKPKIGNRNLGDRVEETVQDPFTGVTKVTGTARIGQSPDSRATQATAANRLKFDKEQAAAGSGEDAGLDPLTTRQIAQQYLAGDGQALANIGRGAQGAKNLVKVRDEIARQANAAGMNGADIAAKMAEFGGLKAGQRTAGTRSASIEIAAQEAAELAPLALEASQKVARSGLLPFGKAQIMFNNNTNDPNLRQFAMANNALANAYGQVMSRGGVATVSDKEHAKELLSTAFDQPSYAAAVEQLQSEIRAAQKAPKTVRRELSAETSGRNPHGVGGAAAPTNTKGWVLHTDARGNKAYVSPDGKSFEEVK